MQQELKDATAHFNALVCELQKTNDRPAGEGQTDKHRDDKTNRYIIDLTTDEKAAEFEARYKEEVMRRFDAEAAALAERDAAFQAALKKHYREVQ